MKKTLTLFFIALAINAFAQKWTPKVGVTVQSSGYGSKDWFNINFGYFLGAGHNFKLKETLFLRTEILLNSNVRDVTYPGNNNLGARSVFQRRNYVSAPILLRKTFQRKKVEWFVEGGLYLSYQFGGHGRDGTYTSTGWSYYDYKIRHSNMGTPIPPNGYVYFPNHFAGGFQLGVGAIINKKIELGLRYGNGLGNKGVQLSVGLPLR